MTYPDNVPRAPIVRYPTIARFRYCKWRVFIWNRRDGMTMRLKRFTNSGGLLKASCELTYAKLGRELAL